MSEATLAPGPDEGEGGAGGGTDFPVPPAVKPEQFLSAPEWGMAAFLLSDVALFGTLIAAYVSFLGKDQVGPTPAEALSLPLVLGTTACLLSSSGTIHLAERALRRGSPAGFSRWWAATIVLGLLFLAGTAYEWYGLIVHHHLTISRNLFGTTYYTLVGFHATHVSIGVILMVVVFDLASRRQVTAANGLTVELTAWYWHFVDGVWVVVFTVVYLIGR
jgi:cytochrome c oxidase subunit 3/cytochrome o ubiquinol oxidase subunit 3